MLDKIECVESIEDNRLLDLYNFIKDFVIKKGYKQEIEWCSNIPEIEKIDKWYFFEEYAWVVINSGMKSSVAEKIFNRFWNNGDLNLDAIGHPHKRESIEKVFDHLDRYFKHLVKSKNMLKYIVNDNYINIIKDYMEA